MLNTKKISVTIYQPVTCGSSTGFNYIGIVVNGPYPMSALAIDHVETAPEI